ncbi:DUF6527 family protein [Mesorhizobium sp. LjNodule214]|uniref:DUF6527 family protein n=1 Tax=Mesorhizobium sp. LjNodule214 TaxID=3342252 RepID=UPI003F4F9426
MICPCGCRARIQLSLVPRDKPSWKAEVGCAGVVTLKPSIWRVKDCRAHFFVRAGRIVWARDSGIAQPPDMELGHVRSQSADNGEIRVEK